MKSKHRKKEPTHTQLLEELKEDIEEGNKIQYGLKEFFQGLMIGVILGFILGWFLLTIS